MLFNYLKSIINVKFPSFSYLSNTKISASLGDITKYNGGAIVNAANTQLMAGGGVCGAIFEASDFEKLEEACSSIGYCPTGKARVTPSFGMPSSWIVHAVGPIWNGGNSSEAELLGSAYTSALEEAHKIGVKSIAFPAISTGIYGYPLKEATMVAVESVRKYTSNNPDHFRCVDFLCFDQKTLSIYQETLDNRELIISSYPAL